MDTNKVKGRMTEMQISGKELAKEIHDADVPFETWMIGYRIRTIEKILKGDGE